MSRWILDDGREIHLVPPVTFAALPNGTVLWCIDGTRVVKGVDAIDDDTRHGYMAYGLPVWTPPEEKPA